MIERIFDTIYTEICFLAVWLSICFRNVPILGETSRRLTLVSGSVDTNASLCLFLRFLYTWLPEPYSFDDGERLFGRVFLESQYLLFGWIVVNISWRLLPPLVRPIFIIYYGRARLAKNFITKCLTERKVKQIVILGSGYDTTAYRVDHGVTIFEVDLPSVQRSKIDRMRSTFGSQVFDILTKNVIYVPCDFISDQSVQGRLILSGYNVNLPTAILWEGVTYYLPKEAVMSTLAEMRQLVTKSDQVWLFMDYIDQNLINNPSKSRISRVTRQQCDTLGTPFISGFTDIEFELEKFDLKSVSLTSANQAVETYFNVDKLPKQIAFLKHSMLYEPGFNFAECIFSF